MIIPNTWDFNFTSNGGCVRKILICAGEISIEAILKDNFTADALWKALPLESSVNTWGNEIYFNIPLQLKEAEDARDVVALGDLGYWPPGKSFCIFFGRTPASRNNEIRAASVVNVFGMIEGDATIFKEVPDGTRIRVSKVGD